MLSQAHSKKTSKYPSTVTSSYLLRPVVHPEHRTLSCLNNLGAAERTDPLLGCAVHAGELKSGNKSCRTLRSTPSHPLVTSRPIEHPPAFELIVILPCLPASCVDGTRVRLLEPHIATLSAPRQPSVCGHAAAGEVMSTARRQGAARSCHRKRWGSSHGVGVEQEKRVR